MFCLAILARKVISSDLDHIFIFLRNRIIHILARGFFHLFRILMQSVCGFLDLGKLIFCEIWRQLKSIWIKFAEDRCSLCWKYQNSTISSRLNFLHISKPNRKEANPLFCVFHEFWIHNKNKTQRFESWNSFNFFFTKVPTTTRDEMKKNDDKEENENEI